MDPVATFETACREEIARLGQDDVSLRLTREWFNATQGFHYSYHFRALGRPVIQYPQDIVAIQELIWSIRPTLIIETGIAHGGSLVLSAAMLALLDYTDAVGESGRLDVAASRRRVIGIDIDIRSHNRAALDAHPLRHKIEMIEGSSIDPAVIAYVRSRVKADDTVMVVLDSNHVHAHVLTELEAYAPLTSVGSYCIVFDTVIEYMPAGTFPNRSWDIGNNPKTAVRAFFDLLAAESRLGIDGRPLLLEVDREIEDKLLITVAPGGYLRRLVE